MKDTTAMAKGLCALITAITFLNTNVALAGNPIWLGAEFSGTDSVTGQTCSVKIDQMIDGSIFGDTISLVTTVGAEKEAFRLTNHPFFGGRTYGKALYQMSVEKNAQGVSVSVVDEFWVELSVEDAGDRVEFEARHMGTTQGGMMIRSPKGTLNKCSLKKI